MIRSRTLDLLWLILALLLALLLPGCGQNSRAPASDDTITIGWTAWDDAEFVTRLAKAVIETHTDHPVDLELAGIKKQYAGVAGGQLDAMLMAWLPDVHARYWSRYKDRLVDLGTLYSGGRLGWVVPDYIPPDKLGSITDLARPSVADRLNHRIQGIDPGAGLMQKSLDTLRLYNLNNDYRLVAASGSAMTEALAKTEKNRGWIVVTGWTPHWMFSKWPLRFLKDPKDALGEPQRIDVVVKKGFANDYPKIAAMLAAMHLSLAELQAAMFDARQTNYEDAIACFLKRHEAQVQTWVRAGDRT